MAGNRISVYTIVATGIDIDRGRFPTPEAMGSFLSRSRALRELDRLIAEEKETLDKRCDTEERGETYWEAYEEGYAAARFTRLEMFESELNTEEVHDGKPC